MAQILAPSTQWQMRMTKNPANASPFTTKMWGSLFLKQKTKGTAKFSTKFRVCASKSESSTVNRLDDLLNMDIRPYTDKIIAEYVWIGGTGIDLRSKSRTISKPVEHPSELPKWNYDGSSTGQAPGEDSEVILYPQAIFKDPFRGGNNILVICDSYTPAGEPIPTNKRHRAAEIFGNKKVIDEVPWFGIEQEYTLLQPNVKWPLGWPVGAYPGPQMLTTRLVYMRELTLVAPMGKLCQASGNIKLVLVLGLKLGIISGVLDTFLRGLLNKLVLSSHLIQSR